MFLWSFCYDCFRVTFVFILLLTKQNQNFIHNVLIYIYCISADYILMIPAHVIYFLFNAMMV